MVTHTKGHMLLSGMNVVGASGLEPPTPTMSRWCSNQLSYAPIVRGESIAGLGGVAKGGLQVAVLAFFSCRLATRSDTRLQLIAPIFPP